MMSKVLLVGSGLTSAALAALIRNSYKEGCHITVWEKLSSPGGRMNTTYCPTNKDCGADLGAQFITATANSYRMHKQFYDELIDTDILRNLTAHMEGLQVPPGCTNYIAPRGISSVVHYFHEKSDLKMKLNHEVESINLNLDDNRWKVISNDGITEYFDSVLLTIPIPQIVQLKGTVQSIMEYQPEIYTKLHEVTYTSRYALGVFYDEPIEVPIPCCAKFVTDDDCIRFISVDNQKRDPDNFSSPTSIVVHTTAPFGELHLDNSVDEVQKIIVRHLKRILPGLPKPSHIHCQKWEYSQVKDAYPESPGYLILCENPFLACAGDGFSTSNFDGCVSSAVSLHKFCVDKNFLINS